MTALAASALLALATTCGAASGVPSDLTHEQWAARLEAVAMTESGGDPYAIGVNADPARGLPHVSLFPPTADQAIAEAKALLARGRRIDFGLMGISDANLAHHNLTIVTAFDACRNMAAGAQHLADDHAWVLAHRRYNCGRTDCGVAYAQTMTATIEGGAPPAQPCPEPDDTGWHVTAPSANCSKPCRSDQDGWHVSNPASGCEPTHPLSNDRKVPLNEKN